MTSELIGYYERLLEAEPMLVEAVGSTVVEGCGPNQALELMGADPVTAGRARRGRVSCRSTPARAPIWRSSRSPRRSPVTAW
jgi:hypothetical protein